VIEDPIMRGRRWDAFFNEEGGLKDMLAEVQRTYLERLSAVEPSNVTQLQVLALAARVTRELEGMVRTIVSGGNVAQAAKEYTTRMQAIPDAKRRYM
jgi:hypothetical protein